MSRHLLNTALAFAAIILAYYVARNHDVLFAPAPEPLAQAFVDSLLSKAPDNARATARHTADAPLDEGIEQPHYESFVFDPNTADTTALLRLGFPRWMVRSILRYRARGGRYQVREDVKAIYGMTPELYERIEKFISIDQRYKPYDRAEVEAERRAARTKATDSVAVPVADAVPAKLTGSMRLDLNEADSAALCRIPGIGPYRARQIVGLRNRLGGFVGVEQLRDVEGLPDSCLRWLGVSPCEVRKLDINRASLLAMKRHPYIGGRRAVDIDRLRRQNGRISSLWQLSLLPSFSPADLERLQPYITFGK